MHGVDETKTLLHTALADKLFDCAGDVHESAPARHFKPELFGQRFHDLDMPLTPVQRNISTATVAISPVKTVLRRKIVSDHVGMKKTC